MNMKCQYRKEEGMHRLGNHKSPKDNPNYSIWLNGTLVDFISMGSYIQGIIVTEEGWITHRLDYNIKVKSYRS